MAVDKLPTAATRTTAIADNQKFSEEVHNYVREYIRNADQKATFFFATLTAIPALIPIESRSIAASRRSS